MAICGERLSRCRITSLGAFDGMDQIKWNENVIESANSIIRYLFGTFKLASQRIRDYDSSEAWIFVPYSTLRQHHPSKKLSYSRIGCKGTAPSGRN
jgi:hypothetical protein